MEGKIALIVSLDNIFFYVAPQPTPSPTNSSTNKDLPIAAIVMIGVGAYLGLVLLFLLVRQCLKVGCHSPFNIVFD